MNKFEESRTWLFSAGAARREIREAIGLSVLFPQGKERLAVFLRSQ